MVLTEMTPETLLVTLKQRFVTHPQRHVTVSWAEVQGVLLANRDAFMAVVAMEASGGEPDVVMLPGQVGMCFIDCAMETPSLRRNLCYDQVALEKRKANKPNGSAVEWTKQYRVSLLTIQQYQALQAFGPFDQKTSSWVQTPQEVREKGGALFGDSRYGMTFIYHNGAESYYASRGFRVMYTVKYE
ncbi:MAG: DUF4256 domain-containing protein [Culicoidibacterales bacterium]